MKPSRPLLGLLIGLAAAAATPARGDTDQSLKDCLAGPNATSSAGMNDCIVHAAEVWTRRLESAYQRLLAGLDPASRKLLEAAQDSWVSYRSKELAFVHGPWRQQAGTVAGLELAALRLAELQDRTRTLEGYLAAK